VIPLPWEVVVAACAAVAVGALVQSVSGFGLGLLSGPVLAALDPVLVPAPVLLVTVVLGLVILRRDRGRVAWREVGLATAGRLAGSVVAADRTVSGESALIWEVAWEAAARRSASAR